MRSRSRFKGSPSHRRRARLRDSGYVSPDEEWPAHTTRGCRRPSGRTSCTHLAGGRHRGASWSDAMLRLWVTTITSCLHVIGDRIGADAPSSTASVVIAVAVGLSPIRTPKASVVPVLAFPNCVASPFYRDSDTRVVVDLPMGTWRSHFRRLPRCCRASSRPAAFDEGFACVVSNSERMSRAGSQGSGSWCLHGVRDFRIWRITSRQWRSWSHSLRRP